MPQNLLDYLPQDFLSRIGLPEVSYPVCRTTATLLAPADPQRVVLIFGGGSGASGLIISTDPQVNTTDGGLVIGAQATGITFSYWVHGPIVCAPWYGVVNTISTIVPIITQSLLASAQVGNESPVPIPPPPIKRVPNVSGPLQSLWLTLTGRHVP